MKVDLRIMACRKRRAMVLDLLGQLSLEEDRVVTYDDRGEEGGGDALYNARRAWLHPLDPDCTHRVVLQDDIEVCTDFRETIARVAAAFPFAIFQGFLSRIRPHHRRNPDSPYIRIRGGACNGPAILMPAHLIPLCFAWYDRVWQGAYRRKDDDVLIGEFAHRHNLYLLTSVPSLVQHLAPLRSLVGVNHGGKVSKVWAGRDVSGENWDSREVSSTEMMRNQIQPYLTSADRNHD